MGTAASTAASVGRWGRHIVALGNASYSGNPFELEVDAVFTHTGSGTQLTLAGYYAGNDTWKIGFMPTEVGEWTWVTSSSDPDLDNQSGTVTAVASARRGQLAASGKKWRYSDGGYVVPVGVFTQLMHGAGSTAEVETFADFLQANRIHLVNFRLCEQDICFASVASRTFDLTLWDRLEERLEILAERGIGVDVMLYTDDGGKPSYGAESAEEALLVRYAVARLAGFPVVNFNTGIDIWEYRGSTWHDWYGNLVRALDPYGHPVSSRGRAGDSTSFMSAGVRTYNSVGDRNSTFARMLAAFQDGDEASMNNDNFGEDRTGINGHTPADIRRTGWKALLAGGVGFHVRDNINNDCANGVTANCDTPFTVADIESRLDSEQWLELLQLFTDQKLGAVFGSLLPESALVGNGWAIADPARTTIVYLYLGTDDSWDAGTTDPLEVKLSSLSGNFDATWFDPRTGAETFEGVLVGGSDYGLAPPTGDDWVLLLQDGDPLARALEITPPSGGTVRSTPPGIDCGTDCQEDFAYMSDVALTPTPDYGMQFGGWEGDPECWDGEILMLFDTICGALFGACALDAIVDVPPQTVDDSRTFEACNELTVGAGGFVVASTGVVTLEAGNVVEIHDGLSVEGAGQLAAAAGGPGLPGDPPPTSPTGLTALASDGQVALDWNDNPEPDLAGYRVYRGISAGGPHTHLAGLLPISEHVDSSVTNGTTYFYVVTAEDGAGNESGDSAEASATPSTGLAGHWRFDEGVGTTLGDETGASAGAIFGASWVAGVSGSGLEFDGAADHVVLDSTPELDITGSQITLAAWIFPHNGGTSNGSRVISKRTDPGGSDVYSLYTQGNHVRFRLDEEDMISSGTFVNDQWLHVAAVYNGTDKRIYLDGVLDPAAPTAKTDPIDSSSRAVHFGKREDESRFFDGVIDEVRIYNRALTATEVADLAAVPPP